MSGTEEKLNELETKMNDVSTQLDGVLQLIHEERKTYYKGLVMGLLLGILGNMFVSNLMKVFEIFNPPHLVWVVSTGFSYASIILFVWLMYKEIKNSGFNPQSTK